MLVTTLNDIRGHGPCDSGWIKLLRHLGKPTADDEPLPFEVILKSNGLADALWCCRAAPEYNREWRLYAVWCALQVKHLMKDRRSLRALVLAEKYANGLVTDNDLAIADRQASYAVERARINLYNFTEMTVDLAARDSEWNAAGVALCAVWDSESNVACATAGKVRYMEGVPCQYRAQSKVFLWVVNGGLAAFEG